MRRVAFALFAIVTLLAPGLSLWEASARATVAPGPLSGLEFDDEGYALAMVLLRPGGPVEGLASSLAAAGARDVRPLAHGDAVVARLAPDLAARLPSHPLVEGIVGPTRGTLADEDGCAHAHGTLPASPWWLGHKTGIGPLRSAAAGAGTRVAIVDTGVDPDHPDLLDAYQGRASGVATERAWFDATGASPSAPRDDCGHGTAVAGMAVGKRAGVAPGAAWIAARVGENDVVLDLHVYAAFDWLLGLPPESRPHVVVNSWGFSSLPAESSARMAGYVQKLRAAGMLPIFAAGNLAAPSKLLVPADFPEAFAVGGLDPEGNQVGAGGPSRHDHGGVLLPESQWHHVKPDLVAPAAGIVSTWRGGSYAAFGETSTSLAAPIVAGVALLAKAAQPWLTAPEMEAVLRQGADFRAWSDTTINARPNNLVGYGGLNAERTLEVPATFGRGVMLVGDTGGAIQARLPAWVEAKAYGTTRQGIEQAIANVHRYGVLVLGGLDPAEGQHTALLLEQAKAHRVGVLLLGEPGQTSSEFDGVQFFVDSRVGSFEPRTATGKLQGSLLDNRTLLSRLPNGSFVPIRDYGGTASRSFDAFHLPAALGASPLLGAGVPDRHVSALVEEDGHRYFLLANSLASVEDSETEITPETINLILEAAAWARLRRYDPDATGTGRPSEVTAPVVVVGDHHNQIGRLLTDMRIPHAKLGSSDLMALKLTIDSEETRRGEGEEPILQLVVYNDLRVADLPTLELDAFHEAELDRARLGIRALVLGGPGTKALQALQGEMHYVVDEAARPTTIVSAGPHPVNAHALAGATRELALAPSSFQGANWRTIYEAGGAPVAAESPEGTAVVLGFGSVGAQAWDADASDVVRRAIDWLVPPASLDAPIKWQSVEDVRRYAKRHPSIVREASPGSFLIDGISTGGHTVEILNVSANLTIRNSAFSAARDTPALVLSNLSRNVDVVGNSFTLSDPAIRVSDSPNVRINYNSFARNHWALERADQRLEDSAYVVDATRNHLLQFLNVGLPIGPSAEPVHALVDLGEYPNAAGPGFNVLPYCVDAACSRTFPGVERGYVPDANEVVGGVVVTATPANALLVYQSGRDFALETFDGEGATRVSGTLASPPGWVRRQLQLEAAETAVDVRSTSGRGTYDLLLVPTSQPLPESTLLESSFSQDLGAWTGVGATHVAGADGRAGHVELPAGATLDAPYAGAFEGASFVFYTRLEPGAEGTLQVNWTQEIARPLFRLGWSEAGLTTDLWSGAAPPERLGAGSWHRVELRFDLPRVHVLLDHRPVGSAFAIAWPDHAARAIDATLRFQSASGQVAVDDPRVFRGEAVAGVLERADFHGGFLGNVRVAPSGSGGGGAVLLDGSAASSSNPSTRLLSVQEVRTTDGSEVRSAAVWEPDLSGFSTSGGSAAYANGQSLLIEGQGSTKRAWLALPGNLTRYAFEQYASIPSGRTFSGFTLLNLTDASGATLLSVRLQDNNAYLDVDDGQLHMNVAEMTRGSWHKVTAYVDGASYTLAIDGVPVLGGRLAHAAPVAEWSAGAGQGVMVVDNLLFGLHGLIEMAEARLALDEEGWLVNSTSAAGGVARTETIASSDPTRPDDPPLLSTGLVRIRAPGTESSVSWAERRLPSDSPARAYEVSYAVYVPALNPLYQPDGFFLLSLERETSGGRQVRYGIALHDSDERVEIVRNGVVEASSTFPKLTRERWYTIRATVAIDGSITASVNGAALPGLGPGARPHVLVLGDRTPTLNPLTTGGIGTGEMYVDDLNVRREDSAPTVSITSPASGATLSGRTVVEGAAADPDPNDGVRQVQVTLVQAGAPVAGPWNATGATAWRQELNTTRWPKGSYQIEAVASDGRRASPTASVSVSLDNSPVGGVTSPAASRLGGVVTIGGQAAPRAPLSPGEEVDAAEYTLDGVTWTPLAVRDGNWSFGWDTRHEPQGPKAVTVRATKWLDTATWARTFTVDQSPTPAFQSPNVAIVGGHVTFRGTMTDNYPAADDWSVPTADCRFDISARVPANVTHVSGALYAWECRLDTHPYTEGWHVFEMRALKYGHSAKYGRWFYVDNTPIVTVESPDRTLRARDLVVFRGTATDPRPSPEAPYVAAVTVQVDSGPETTIQSVPVEGQAGKVAWRHVLDTRLLADGAHTVKVRARDGVSVHTETFTLTVANADGTLPDGATFDYSRGNGTGDVFTFTVPTDVTRLELRVRSLEPGGDAVLYLSQGQVPTNATYRWRSGGPSGDQTLVLTPLDGLVGGTYHLRVESTVPTDYRLEKATTKAGGGLPGLG